jgi:hypothetical protein
VSTRFGQDEIQHTSAGVQTTGVDEFWEARNGRPGDALLANAVIDTNITRQETTRCSKLGP